jgi:hypothetical protein
MKVRTTVAGAGLSAMLTVTGCGAMTILVSAAVSGCSGGTTPTSSLSTPVTTPPTPSIVNTTPADTTPTPTSSIQTAAPATGGGGTAGLEDVPLFLFGGAAVLVGAGGLAYRRKIIRKH